MKNIKVNFADYMRQPYINCWNEKVEDPLSDNIIWKTLNMNYKVEISDNPDIVFCYVPVGRAGGLDYLKYKNCIRVQVLQESVRPDFNCFDFAIGLYDDIKYEDRYFFIPTAIINTSRTRKCYENMTQKHQNVVNDLLKRDFCSFVVSNGYDCEREREYFYEMLNKYKKIDSGGRFMNNVGGPVADKMKFEMNHKFAITFENAWYAVTSDRIDEAFAAKTVPIYWGNPNVGRRYNEKAFINCHAFASFEEVINKIKEIDNNDELYMSMLKEPALMENKTLKQWEDELALFLDHIINYPENKAVMRTNVGWPKIMEEVRCEGMRIYERKKKRKKRFIKFASFIGDPIKNTAVAKKIKRMIIEK